MTKNCLVTGSSGLIGSEVAAFFHARDFAVHGVDNNQREAFFGPQGNTRWNQARLQETLPGFTHHELDIRDRAAVLKLVETLKPAVIIHTAAQPSHDLAASVPFDDFDVNAVGTLNLLEAARRHCPESPFIHMSTNKVYGDRPNTIALKELERRWDYADPQFAQGIPETFSIDQSKHSLFGASKVAGDVMVQEYGRYFGLPTCCLRGGCLTGPNHSGVELHGFLSYLVKCNLEGRQYKIYGYKGKQVRDNIHSVDVAGFMFEFYQAPGRARSITSAAARELLLHPGSLRDGQACTGKKQIHTYLDQARSGDHICYYSDLRKMRSHYPRWQLTRSLPQIFEEIVASWRQRMTAK